MIRWKVDFIPELKKSTLIEGLPGIGNVGKVSVEYLIEKLKAKKFAELYSDAFPYHVFVNEDDTVDMPRLEFFYTEKPEIVFITGDIQPMTPEGHYEMAEEIVRFLDKVGVNLFITLGGFGVKELPEKPKIMAAVTKKGLKNRFSDLDISFESGERVGIIIGASGLILGFAKLEGKDGICLMGETLSRPMFTDTKAAASVLNILSKIVGIEIDMKEIEDRSCELDKALSKAQEIEQKMMEQMAPPVSENLRYIG